MENIRTNTELLSADHLVKIRLTYREFVSFSVQTIKDLRNMKNDSDKLAYLYKNNIFMRIQSLKNFIHFINSMVSMTSGHKVILKPLFTEIEELIKNDKTPRNFFCERNYASIEVDHAQKEFNDISFLECMIDELSL